MILSEDFLKNHMWILVIIILVFTIYVGYILNKNIDPSEIEEDKDEEETNLNNTDENK